MSGIIREKFVSAETYEHILGLDKVLYGVCNHDKRFIAEAVSVGVVAKLEVVNIYDGDSAEKSGGISNLIHRNCGCEPPVRLSR